MFLSLLSFEPDQDHEERERGLIELVKTIPAVHLALIGDFRDLGGGRPERQRAVLLAFEELSHARRLADGSGLPKALREAELSVETIAANVEVPLAPRSVGQRFFALTASFDYSEEAGDPEQAERHYFDYHVPQSRLLPNLRGYIIGALLPEGCRGLVRRRMGIEIFDSRDALAASFRSPVGKAMREDGARLCANVSVHHFDCEVHV